MSDTRHTRYSYQRTRTYLTMDGEEMDRHEGAVASASWAMSFAGAAAGPAASEATVRCCLSISPPMVK